MQDRKGIRVATLNVPLPNTVNGSKNLQLLKKRTFSTDGLTVRGFVPLTFSLHHRYDIEASPPLSAVVIHIFTRWCHLDHLSTYGFTRFTHFKAGLEG